MSLPIVGPVDTKWLLLGAVVGVVVFTRVLPRVAPGLKAKLG
jgi:hypothetical protein